MTNVSVCFTSSASSAVSEASFPAADLLSDSTSNWPFSALPSDFDPPPVLSLSDAVSVSDSAAFSRSSEMLVAVFFPVTTASVVT